MLPAYNCEYKVPVRHHLSAMCEVSVAVLTGTHAITPTSSA